MLDKATREMLRERIGITDKDMDKLGPGIAKLELASSELMKYKIIAEVTDSKYCFLGVKVGDKIVIKHGTISKEETTCPLCLRAIGPLTPFVNVILDRIAEGVDPNDMVFRNSECLDPGLEHGGLGKVRFKIYTEKIG